MTHPAEKKALDAAAEAIANIEQGVNGLGYLKEHGVKARAAIAARDRSLRDDGYRIVKVEQVGVLERDPLDPDVVGGLITMDDRYFDCEGDEPVFRVTEEIAPVLDKETT